MNGAATTGMKHQGPNSKHQRNTKHQQTFKSQPGVLNNWMHMENTEEDITRDTGGHEGLGKDSNHACTDEDNGFLTPLMMQMIMMIRKKPSD
jgi:hypothetical protein